MVYINEWFPNPIGKDASSEFVELLNRSNASISLNGWALWTGGKSKESFLSGRIGADGYAVLKKAQTKLSLKNSDGGLWLYGPGGGIIDHAAFAGAAPAGESFSRVDYGTEDNQHFAFVDPTPGALNKTVDNGITIRHYPLNVPLDPPVGPFQFFGLLVAAALVLTASWAYIVYKNENISQFIFKKDPSIG